MGALFIALVAALVSVADLRAVIVHGPWTRVYSVYRALAMW